MHKFLLTTLLASLSTCAFALFPIQTDWQANHLQGKVKSVISQSEDNPETVEGEDLFGWLIPMDRTTEFISEKSGNHFCEEKWERFEIFAIWKLENGTVTIHFQEF